MPNRIVTIEEPDQTDRPSILKKLAGVDGVLFTGGDQTTLINKIADSQFHQTLKDRYWNDQFVIAGTSAGAAAMAGLAIKDGKSGESLIKGMVETEKGLGLCADTGVVITKGNVLKPIGSGVVTILELDELKATNYHQVRELQPVFIDALKVRMLAPGARYQIKERTFTVLAD